jgi:hypothetical protein
VTSTLGHGNHEGRVRDLIVCLPQTWLEGSSLWSLRVSQEVVSPAFGSHRGVPWPEYPYSLKRNFSFHWLLSDLLLSESDLKGREFIKYLNIE